MYQTKTLSRNFIGMLYTRCFTLKSMQVNLLRLNKTKFVKFVGVFSNDFVFLKNVKNMKITIS